MLPENIHPPTLSEKIQSRLQRSIHAALGMVTMKAPDPVPFQNAAAWCTHGKICTRVVFYNYFWRNHHEESVALDVQLISSEGIELWRTTITVASDQTVCIDSADIAAQTEIDSFEGYLVFSTALARVPAAIELIRFNVDYYTPEGGISTVHDQGIFAPAPFGYPHSLGKMEVQETEEISTALIFWNSQGYTEEDISIEVSVYRHDGQVLDIGSFTLQPREVTRIELGEVCPGLRAFLEGKPGQVVIASDCYIKRAAVLHHAHRDPSTYYSVNHSEEYRGHSPYLDAELSEEATARKGPVAPMPFFHNFNSINTDFVVFHDVPSAGDKQVYGLNLYSPDGQLLYENENIAAVPLHGTARFRVSDMLAKDISTYGLAQVYLAGSPGNDRWQKSFPADVHFQLASGWDAMYSQGSYASINSGEGSRTRVFSRAYYDEAYKSEIILFHAVSDETSSSVPSQTLVTLCHPNGTSTVTRTLNLPPLSTRIINLPDLFPEIEQFGLGPAQPCGIYIRDITAKIIAVHFTRTADGKSIATDHFYGG